MVGVEKEEQESGEEWRATLDGSLPAFDVPSSSPFPLQSRKATHVRSLVGSVGGDFRPVDGGDPGLRAK